MKKSGDFVETFYFVAVPITDIFEHLDATTAEATPLYELCASVLSSAPPLRTTILAVAL